jgi:hypothetical protein
MPDRGAAHLAAAMRGAACYLEYGAGGSTLLAARIGVADTISVESDPAWLKRVEEKLRGAASSAGKTHLLSVDIGPTRALGYPTGSAHRSSYRNYPLEPWRYCVGASLSPNLVLVDGRFRLACMLAALRNARPGCRILLDDYRWRRIYRRVEIFVCPVAMIGRMAEFVVPENLDLVAIDEAFEAAVDDPR